MKLAALIVILLSALAAPAAANSVPHHQRHHRATNHAGRHRAGYKEVPEGEFNPPMESLWSVPQILELALHDGEEYWHGAPPCNGEIQFQADIPPQLTPAQQRGVARDISMWATWSDNVEGTEWFWREGPQYDATNFTNCVIHYNAESWSSAYMMTKWWPQLATAVAHELEHLENRWQIETPVDGGSMPLASVPKTAVNYPEWTGHNEPATAELHRPPYALTQRQACASWPCEEGTEQ
jgi:hypothetical protein